MIPDVLVTEPTGFDRDSESGGTGHSGVVDSFTGSGTTSTKRPSDAFIGTVIGLMIVLCVPIDYLHSEEELMVWLFLFSGLGAVIGTIIGILRHRPT